MIVLLEGIAGGVVGSVIVFGLLLLAATKVLPKMLPKIMRQMLAKQPARGNSKPPSQPPPAEECIIAGCHEPAVFDMKNPAWTPSIQPVCREHLATFKPVSHV